MNFQFSLFNFLPKGPCRASSIALASSLLSFLFVSPVALSRLSPGAPVSVPALPTEFPRLGYTPFGYIDNPYHSMVFNRSGIIRSVPPLGFGWWRTEFEGNYGGGARNYVDYYCFLRMSVAIGSHLYLSPGDFDRNGATLTSEYHTKSLMSYDWHDGPVRVSLRFFLPRENTLTCLAVLENAGDRPEPVTLNAANMYGIGPTKWWGADGLTARALPGEHAIVSKVWAYGDVFALGSSLQPSAFYCSSSERELEAWLRKGNVATVPVATLRGRGPLWTAASYRLTVPPRGRTTALVCLSRGPSELQALREFHTGLSAALKDLAPQLKEDQAFWSSCPVLEGAWPDSWKRGWVYDFETLRMNVRRPLGIFKHHWDAMQIHSPRAVLGETCLDMMTLSYAVPSLAKEVLEGTFADAPMPNVPCTREDGSMNMISADGSECGTAPMWGYPFHVIQTIFRSTGDSAWITRLYPHLKAYVDWWLANRTDSQGWLHCNNSWESGQDGSRRFLVARGNEGANAEFVRTVDVEASMAEAMNSLAAFAPLAGHPDDAPHWKEMAERRMMNVRSMFFDGSFRDIDGRSNTPIVLPDYHDVMMLAPVACSVATTAQVASLAPSFDYFETKTTIQWPPAMQTYTEACWGAGKRMSAAAVVARTADRIYPRTDSRAITFGDPADPLSWRIPGVANEFWPAADRPPGGENYGWGATLPMFIIRNLVGFHELADDSSRGFTLAPAFPATMLKKGADLRIRNLHYRSSTWTFSFSPGERDRMKISAQLASPSPATVVVTAADGKVLYNGPSSSFSFDAQNGSLYWFHFVS